MRSQTQALIPALGKVLSPPTEQLSTETREQVIELVRYLHTHQPKVIEGEAVLMAVLQ